MNETFVTDMLREQLTKREQMIEVVSEEIGLVRNKLATSTNKRDYISLRKDLESHEAMRRDLRGEISALRQAIKKLEKED